LKKLAVVVAISLILLTMGLVKLATAVVPEPPIGFLMRGVSVEIHGNISVYYDVDGDGSFDLAFLHEKDGEPRFVDECGEDGRLGKYLYVFDGCRKGQTPMIHRLKRQHIAMRGPNEKWTWFIRSTWPVKKKYVPCKHYSFRELRCKR